ncbi:Inner spore coat protein H [Posidoniimonas polymericola]|uniref:Inner spore coat protein H n=1 Tax=Posidoniimonas polymericola TaxID=2528002 RepID=A0A5C5ZCR2_9BACT|nr:lamin tail domain-containing protein [Posidoniimonas polymericola]TWT85199.1 Inner spore coat protein H [Posidoniimonas polymericola]
MADGKRLAWTRRVGRNSTSQPRKRLSLELLEDRRVLAASAVINEFVASNSSSLLDGDGASSDWVELYNPNAAAIDLTGWHLTDNDAEPDKWTFPSVTLDPGGYLVVFASGQATESYVDPLGYLHTNFKLGAGGEYLGLTDPAGMVVHEFAPAFPPQSTDVSFGLDSTGEGFYFTNPTPGAANNQASAVSSKVAISEIMYHPASNVDADEFIEIYNGESTVLNLTGWSLSGAISFDFPAVSLQPGQYLAVASDLAAFAANYPGVTNVVGGWQGTLGNDSETLVLSDANGIAVDRVTYADEGAWATRERGPLDHLHEGWVWSDAHDGGGGSLEVVSLTLTNSRGQNWAASTASGGTPGAANSVQDADNNTAPLIVDLSQLPVIPHSTDAVIVTARLIDEGTAAPTGSVMWRLDGASTFTSAPLSDSGTGPDAIAGDGLYSAVIPAQANGAIVEWYVSAEDAQANARTNPAPVQPSGLQSANLLYQVDDTFDPAALPASGDMPEYRLIMTDAERAELQQIGSNNNEGYSHAQMNGTLISLSSSGVQVRYTVGIRNRGEGSRNELPNSYHVNLPTDAEWEGVTAFNLNTQYTQSQLIGLRAFAAAGLIAEDAAPITVRVNGTNLAGPGSPAYGVYIQLEAADSDFAANHFPEDDNGNLYRALRGGPEGVADLAYLGEDPAAYYPNYEKKTNASQNDYTDLINLLRVMATTPDADYVKQVSKVADIDQWLGYFATVAILGSEETSLATGVGDDYLLYAGAKDPRFMLIPHDFDTILGEGDTAGNPQSGIYRATGVDAIDRLLNHPEILPLYHAKLLDLLQTTFTQENFDQLIDQTLTGFTPAATIADMKAFMDARREYILAEVAGPLTIASNLTTAGGFYSTTQDVVGLSGFAPLAGVESVTVAGQLAQYDPADGSWNFGETLGGVTESFINSPHVWDYLDAGRVPSTDPDSDWRVDDPGWTDSGPSPLGYGGNGEVTLTSYIDTDPGASGTQKNISTYFRTTFNVTNADEITSLNLRLRRDDGAVVYLNGDEVVRSNMPGGVITPSTVASSTVGGSDESTFFEFAINPSRLAEGQNVIAVELHQRNDSSSDTIFDLELTGTRGDSTSLSGVPLTPGINQVRVRAYDGPEGQGNQIAEETVDVWYDNGSTTAVSGVISTDTTWTVAAGPYVVTGDLTVSGGTLTIEPGTTVFFNPGVGLTVSGAGRVVAVGGDTPQQRIRFSHNPAIGTEHWDGLTIENTQSDNRFEYVDFQSGDAKGNAVEITHGRAVFDHVRWLDTNNQVLDLVHPTLIVSNSDIPGISGGETIHLVGLDSGEQLVFDNNTIGKNTSGDDVVDMAPDSSDRQTIYFRNNRFLGGLDDGVDTDGTRVVFENNSFVDFHIGTGRTTTSNAVTTGRQDVSGGTLYSELTLIGNTFNDVDHALLLKDYGFATAINNTFVGATIGAIQMQELAGTNVIGPGLGVALDGNIFWQNIQIFEAIHPDSQITLDRSIVPASLVALGVGNLAANPLLADPAGGDFSLLEGSPAFFAGPNGTDIGAVQAPRYPAAAAGNLQIGEVHYNPLHGSADADLWEVFADGDLFEFIELHNPTGQTIDLSHAALVDGVDFEFPWGTTLAAGERAVLVNDVDIFVSRYGASPRVLGQYAGNLSDGGEAIELVAANGSPIAAFTYGDSNDLNWPAAADGAGPSLEPIDATGDLSDPLNWRLGLDPGGTPGYVVTLAGDYNGDGVVNAADYSVYRDNLGGSSLPYNEPASRGVVDRADYEVWLANYGATGPAGQPLETSPGIALQAIAVDAAVVAEPVSAAAIVASPDEADGDDPSVEAAFASLDAEDTPTVARPHRPRTAAFARPVSFDNLYLLRHARGGEAGEHGQDAPGDAAPGGESTAEPTLEPRIRRLFTGLGRRFG